METLAESMMQQDLDEHFRQAWEIYEASFQTRLESWLECLDIGGLNHSLSLSTLRSRRLAGGLALEPQLLKAFRMQPTCP
jgi:hypothetical protein